MKKDNYKVCINARLFEVEAENENEAKMIALDLYYAETRDVAYTEDAKIM